MRRVLALAFVGVFVTALAQDKQESSPAAGVTPAQFPKKFTGHTEGVNVSVNVRWTLAVSEVLTDGTIRGKITYPGSTCKAEDADFVGRFDGRLFVVPLPFRKITYCDGIVFRLERQGDTYQFKGTYDGQTPRGGPMQLRVTLNPS